LRLAHIHRRKICRSRAIVSTAWIGSRRAMIFDIRSFWFIGSISALGFGFMLFLVRNTYPGNLRRMLTWCGMASICVGSGWGTLFAREWVGQFAFLVLSRVLLSLCITLQYRAVAEIKGLKVFNSLVFGPPLLVFAVCTWFSFALRNLTVMVILFNVIQVATMLVLARALFAMEEGKRPLIDVVLSAAVFLFATSTSLVVAALVWRSHFSADYNFSNPRSVYNNMIAICVFMAVFSMYPVMASERLNRRLTIQAMRDPLTRLYNRRAFEEIAFREISGAARTGLAISIMVFDIDHFKDVNDRHGHAAGDDVLKATADVLRHGLRDEDFLCRWGGDEFCALLPRASREQAQSIAERMLKSFEGFKVTNLEKAIGVEISIGITTNDDHSKGLGALVEVADAALYKAKQAGRKRFAFAPE